MPENIEPSRNYIFLNISAPCLEVLMESTWMISGRILPEWELLWTPGFDPVTLREEQPRPTESVFSVFSEYLLTNNIFRWFCSRVMEATDIKQISAEHKALWLTSRINALSFAFLLCDSKNHSAARGSVYTNQWTSFHQCNVVSKRLVIAVKKQLFSHFTHSTDAEDLVWILRKTGWKTQAQPSVECSGAF